MSVDSSASTQACLEATILDAAIESWRFAAVFERATGLLDGATAQRYATKVAYFRGRIQTYLRDVGFEVMDYEPGAPFDTGLAVTPLNIDDFTEADTLVIDQVLEPTIIGRDGVRRMGTVLLRKVS